MERGLADHRRDWEDLAALDPLWAIASRPGSRHGRWDDDEFMAGGRRKAATIMRTLHGLGAPIDRRRALDFGCGVGRVTIALADHFDEAVGIDIAPTMVDEARVRAAAAGRDDIRFLLNEREDLELLGGERFDLVYSALVLQHLPSREHVARCARALARAVAPGGVLMAQMPARLAPWARVQLARRAYGVLRRAGVPPEVLYGRLRLQPMRLVALPRDRFESLLDAEGLRVETVDTRQHRAMLSCTYLARRPAA
jgi:2-polyprenyl-3-methyl-5-hydroxy-6-metoxy-1,4-benzoquinol methylase